MDIRSLRQNPKTSTAVTTDATQAARQQPSGRGRRLQASPSRRRGARRGDARSGRDAGLHDLAGCAEAPRPPGASHCMTRGNRNAITAPSSNNPALTSSVTCSPCTKVSRAARRSAPRRPAQLPGHLVGLAQRMPRGRRRRRRHPGHGGQPGAYAAFITLPSSAIPIPAPAGTTSPRSPPPRPPAPAGPRSASTRTPRTTSSRARSPSSTNPDSSSPVLSAPPIAVSTSTATAVSTNPPHTIRRGPNRRSRRAPASPAAIAAKVSGSSRSPVSRGRQAQHELQILRRDQFQADQRQHRQHDAAHRGAERRRANIPMSTSGMRAPPLTSYEEDEQHRAHRQRHDGDRPHLAAAQPLHAQDDAEQSHGGRQRADHVPGTVLRAARLGQQQPSHRAD